jgi:mono/diheme cytochrome c family protein
MRKLLLLLAITAACGKNDAPPKPTSGVPNAPTESAPAAGGPAAAAAPLTGAAADAQAKQMFDTVCIACHGTDGKGTGPAAAQLNPKPRDYTDATWQASIKDEDIKKAILLGGAGVGKSPMMPAQPQLKDQPGVVDGLVKIVRGFGKH